MQIPAGTYKLRYALNNPKPDRRANQDRLASWRSWVTWPAGMVFIVEPDPQFPELGRIYARDGYSMDAIRTDGSLTFGMLTSALDPMDETPSDLLRRSRHGAAGSHALQLLDKLYVPLAVIESLLAEIDAEEE